MKLKRHNGCLGGLRLTETYTEETVERPKMFQNKKEQWELVLETNPLQTEVRGLLDKCPWLQRKGIL